MGFSPGLQATTTWAEHRAGRRTAEVETDLATRAIDPEDWCDEYIALTGYSTDGAKPGYCECDD